VHRDLKPSNLFLSRRADGSPLVKVLDFGISKATGGEDSEASLTGSAEVLGSPMYMSPEQVRGAKLVDHRSDVWALGIILFRLLTGKPPFGAGMTVGSALASVVADEPALLRQHLSNAPRALEAIITHCLEKSPEARFSTVADLATALAPFGTDDGRASVVRLVKDHVAVAGLVSERRRWPLLLVCAVVVVALPAAALALLRRAPGPAPVATAATAVEVVSASPAASAPGSATAPASAPPPPSSAVPAAASAPPPHRAVARPRSTGNSHVVKSAATDDRY